MPFGPRSKEGIVVAFSEVSDLPPERLRPIRRPLEPYPAVLPQLLTLAQWLAETNHCPLAETLRLMLPAEMRGGRVQVKTQLTARYTAGAGALPQALERQGRSDKRRMLLTLLKDGQPHPVTELRMLVRDPLEALHNLEAQGLVALSQEEVLRRPGGDGEEEPAPDPPLMPAQQEALDVMPAPSGAGRRTLSAPRGHRQRQDRGLYLAMVRRYAASRGTLRHYPGAGDCPHPADGPLVSRALWPGGGGAALPALRRGALRRVAAHPPWGYARVVIGARSRHLCPGGKAGAGGGGRGARADLPQRPAPPLRRPRRWPPSAARRRALPCCSAAPPPASFPLPRPAGGDYTLLEMPHRV